MLEYSFDHAFNMITYIHHYLLLKFANWPWYYMYVHFFSKCKHKAFYIINETFKRRTLFVHLANRMVPKLTYICSAKKKFYWKLCYKRCYVWFLHYHGLLLFYFVETKCFSRLILKWGKEYGHLLSLAWLNFPCIIYRIVGTGRQLSNSLFQKPSQFCVNVLTDHHEFFIGN